ncbi:hypothetical protein FACS1894206_09070 [Deltaproteobacteria bacterium]|nr:hypothetical protein FACS1894206_09070 [Deltaproteobacteria bacterium]
MTEERIRVKDITAELGVSNKDMLTALRDLNIPAKSHMATLTPDDVERVKERFSSHATDADPVRRETQSGVIVRRRHRETESVVEEKPISAVPAESADSAAADSARAEAPVAKGEKSKRPDKEPMQKARIIRRADAGEMVGSADKDALRQSPQTDAAAASPVSNAAVLRKKASGKGRPRETAAGEVVLAEKPLGEVAADTAQASAIKESSVSSDAVPQDKKTPAKVVRLSKPVMSAEPERGADGAAVSSAPIMAARSDRVEEDGVNTFRTGEKTSAASQVRIISRPSGGSRPGRDNVGTTAASAGTSGGEGRPFGQRAPIPRPGGSERPSGGYAGQGRTFGPRPPFAPAAPGAHGLPPADVFGEGANKKKRQRGRRTVEFEAEEYGKRRKETEAGDEGVWRGKGKKRGKGREANRQTTVTQPIKAAKRKNSCG